jgi:hypothetical protein
VNASSPEKFSFVQTESHQLTSVKNMKIGEAIKTYCNDDFKTIQLEKIQELNKNRLGTQNLLNVTKSLSSEKFL